MTFVVTCDPDYAIWTFKYNSEVRNVVRVAIDLPMNWETMVRRACYSTVIAVKTYIESVGKEKIRKALYDDRMTRVAECAKKPEIFYLPPKFTPSKHMGATSSSTAPASVGKSPARGRYRVRTQRYQMGCWNSPDRSSCFGTPDADAALKELERTVGIALRRHWQPAEASVGPPKLDVEAYPGAAENMEGYDWIQD